VIKETHPYNERKQKLHTKLCVNLLVMRPVRKTNVRVEDYIRRNIALIFCEGGGSMEGR
jgi:hypothetical protein